VVAHVQDHAPVLLDIFRDLGKMGVGSAEVIKNLKDSDDGRFELKTISSSPTKNVVGAYALLCQSRILSQLSSRFGVW
jgi:hypothetical protein